MKNGSQTINSVSFSKDQTYIAVTTESKQLILFDRQFVVLKNILLARVASKVNQVNLSNWGSLELIFFRYVLPPPMMY